MTNFIVTTNVDENDAGATQGASGGTGLSLREALSLAQANGSGVADTITFDTSVFTGGANSVIRLINGQLSLPGTVTIDGAGATDVTITGDVNGDDTLVAGTNITDINASNTASQLDDNVRVFVSTYGSSTVTLNNLTITGGSAAVNGGGIFATADLSFTNTTVAGNRTTGDNNEGGGISGFNDSSITLLNSIVSGNLTSGENSDGGGIYNDGGTLTVTNSTISENFTSGYASFGGGIFNSAGTVTVTNSTISNNVTSGENSGGGGIYKAGGTLTVTNSTIAGNSTFGENSDGGGIFNSAGTLTVVSSTISENRAVGNSSEGGGIYSNTSLTGQTTTITNSTIFNNEAANRGGGIYNGDGLLQVFNSTIAGNNAAVGGGIASFGDNLTETQLSSTIVAGNMATTIGNDISTQGGSNTTNSFTSLGNNLIGDGQVGAVTFFATMNMDGDIVGTTTAPIDPLLGPLADNGGPVQTLALQQGSQAIDAGNNDQMLATDANGNARSADAPNVTNGPDGFTDIGAVEAFETPSLVVTTASDVVDAFDGLTSLREAIDFANSNADASVITFASGAGQAFEVEALIRLTRGELTLSEDVTIDGSTAGGEVVITGDLFGNDITVVDTNITDVAANVEASMFGTAGDLLEDNSRVFNITSSAEDVTLTDLTITGGRTTSGNAEGGGINNDGATLTVTNSTISGNSTSGDDADGGGINNDDGTLTVTNSTISGNSTSGEGSFGAGISNASGTVTVTNSTISGNSTSGNFSDGGGIDIFFGTLTVTNSTISGNSTSGDDAEGGGISSYDGAVTVTNSTVSGNSTSSDFSDGGGIFNSLGSLTVTNSTISGNSTIGDLADGGGIFNSSGTLIVTNSTISGNSTAGGSSGGGGIYSNTDLTGETTTITNSTIYNNATDGAGGGIFNADGLLQVFNSTVSGNQATVGGGISSFGNNTTETQLSSTIVAGNTQNNIGGYGADISAQSTNDTDNSFTSLGNNLIGNGQVGTSTFFNPTNMYGDIVGTSLAPINPLLGSLADNGGPVQTLALLSGSQAIDAGNNNQSLQTLGLDARGSLRSQEIPGVGNEGTNLTDIGAFELSQSETAGNDAINGTSSNEVIDGLAGNDTINGLAGN
ncbi:MAG: choice-of-anchor Q domain-containing protein, partial [Hyphomicrobiales bacterium]